MKKVLFGLFALSTLAFAGETNLYLRAGADLNGRYSAFRDADFDFSLNEKKADDFSWEIAVEATKNINSNLELGLGVAYQKHSNPGVRYTIDTDPNDPGVEAFEMPGYTSIPLYVVAKYNFNAINNFVPYIKANLGYSLNDENDGLNYNSWYKADVIPFSRTNEFEIENGLYYGIGAGFEYNNFTMDLMYQVNEAKGEVRWISEDVPEVERVKKDYDYSRVTLSFGYKFNI